MAQWPGRGDGRTDSAGGPAVPAKRWVYVIPVAAIMYMLAYLDRNNVSVILPYLHGDLALSNADKGLVGGPFFVGYVFLQVPAALLAQRWSARKTVLLLMVAWGVAASLSGLVQTKAQFYAARFALGFFYLVGRLTDVTGSQVTGFAVLSGFLAVAVALVSLGLRPGTRPARRGKVLAAEEV